MKVLVACEFSGVVRRAFRALGHDAWSCDLLPSEDDSPFHVVGDVMRIRDGMAGVGGWDMLIAHPPCTDLAVSGARHFAAKIADGRQERALDFVRHLMRANVERVAIENPVSVISSKIRKPDQIVQPWMFGHPENKATCLWLKGLPKLEETRNVRDAMSGLTVAQQNRVHHMTPGPNRWRERSRTFEGIALAMAEQWGGNILQDEKAA
jgi:site-specific DNA-cytosine methylase